MDLLSQGRATAASPNGLHVRPASQIVRKAKEFESNVVFRVADREAGAKSLFKLQTLEMAQGAEILIDAEGTGSQAAVDALVDLIGSFR